MKQLDTGAWMRKKTFDGVGLKINMDAGHPHVIISTSSAFIYSGHQQREDGILSEYGREF